MDLTDAGRRAWNIVRPLVQPDGSIFAVIEDEVLRQADVSSGHVREAIRHHLKTTQGGSFNLESIEIGLPGVSRPGFLLHVTARPAPEPPAGMDAVADALNAIRTPDVGKDRFPRIAELISIARWHVQHGDREHRMKVVEEAESELRFARRESDMLSEELAKPHVDTRAELISKLEQRARDCFARAQRIAMSCLKRGDAIEDEARIATSKGLALESIIRDLKREQQPDAPQAN